MEQKLAALADLPSDFERFGVSRGEVAIWEDGARTDNSPGTYEWWYFDAHLADGAKIVISFMNKDLATPDKPLSPLLRLDLDLPDGRHFEKLAHYPPNAWSAAKDHCDVVLGENHFIGDLHHYRIKASIEEISVVVNLVAQVPSWRPGTGYMVFGAERSLEFAWLPSIPKGEVSAAYCIDGESHETTGSGYHDHNWGNVGLMKVVHHWYWARGQAGPYTVIASYITSTKRFGFESIPVFMLVRDDVLIGDDPSKVTFEKEGSYVDQKTGKPVAATTRYTYADGDEHYVVTFRRSQTLSADRMVETLTGAKRLAARLVRFDGAYLRFAGDLEITHHRSGHLVETNADKAIWELMYFGHAMQ